MFEHAMNVAGRADALHLSEVDLREIVASTYELLIVARRDGGTVAFSPGWERVLGYTVDELRDKRLADLIHPDDRPAALAALEALRVRGERCELENRYRHRDGSYRWLHWTGLLLPAQDRICAFGYDATAKRQAEQAMEESERRFNLAAKAASVGVWEIDLRTNATYYTETWKTVLGYEKGEIDLDFRTWANLCHPDDLGQLQTVVERVISDPRAEGFEVEHRMRAKDGSWRWVLARGAVLERDESGRGYRLCGTSIDITERKRIENELQRLVTIVDESPLLVSTSTAVSLSPDERITYMNAACLRLLRLPDNCLEKGMRIRDVMAPRCLQMISEQGIPAACERGFWRGETAVVDADGGEIPVEQFIVAHHGGDGDVEYLSTIMRDLTEQKRSEQAVRESERRFRTIFESAPYSVIIQDLEGRFIDVNPYFLESSGVSREYVIGRTAQELPAIFAPEMTPEWAARKAELSRQLLETGSIKGVETVSLRRSDGQRRNVMINVRLLTLDGQLCTLAVVMDVTELRQMERQVRQAQKMDAVGRLAGGVAHDFNNLLTVIGGYTDLALREIREGHPMHTQLVEVNRAAARASQLTRQLLTFSRSEAVAPDLIDLSAVVSETERMLCRLIGEHITIETTLEPALPAVLADSGQIAQVLMNLAVNARDAMPNGGRIDIATFTLDLDNGRARALALPAGRYVCLRVRDTGTGMDEETLGKIFEPFFTTKGAGRGTGLGLSIVYGIIKQCGGGVRVESRPGAGTCLDVLLPVTKAAAAPAPPKSIEEIPRGSGAVLLVEDDAALRKLAGHILSDAGYQVLPAGDAEAAIAMFQTRAAEISVLLTDLTLPGMNGRALARQLAAAKPSLTIVYMSGYSSDVNFDDKAAGECDDFAGKPFLPATLLKTVQRAIQKKAQASA